MPPIMGIKSPVQGQSQEVNDHLINNIGACQAMADASCRRHLAVDFFQPFKKLFNGYKKWEMNNK